MKCYGYPTGKLLRVVRRPTGGGGWWYDYQYATEKSHGRRKRSKQKQQRPNRRLPAKSPLAGRGEDEASRRKQAEHGTNP